MKTKIKKISKVLAIFCLSLMTLQCAKREDEIKDPSTATVKFTIDGKNYSGSMSVIPSTVTTCPSSKAVVIADATGSYAITLYNYKSITETVYNPLENGNLDSCVRIWLGVIDGSANVVYFSGSGTWTINGSNFTLNCTAINPVDAKVHNITATGKLQ